jgi:ribosomal protein S18 acetylase RimI-like enzyme
MGELEIREAGPEDVGALTRLINAAFVVEREHFKDRDRTSDDEVRNWLKRGHFFVVNGVQGPRVPAKNVTDIITNKNRSAVSDGASVRGTAEPAACVYVEPRGESCYFGLLSVDPTQQGRGLGRRLTQFAEEWARAQGATAMELRYVDLREELGRTYARMGYAETSREDVPPGRGFTLKAQFVNMRKAL